MLPREIPGKGGAWKPLNTPMGWGVPAIRSRSVPVMYPSFSGPWELVVVEMERLITVTYSGWGCLKISLRISSTPWRAA